MFGLHDDLLGVDHAATRVRERVATAVSERVRLVDAALLLLPPAVLVAVFALPRATREAFTLSYVEPTLATMYASHFVHLDAAHLATNLLIYFAVVPVAAALCALAGRRTQFYVVAVVVLAAFPMVLSVLNVALARPRVGYGFSGVAMAFLGTLPHAVGWYVRSRSGEVGPDGYSPDRYSPVLFFAGAGVVSVWAVPLSPGSLLAGGLSLFAALLYLGSLVRSAPGSGLATARRVVGRAAREWPGVEFALAGGLLVLLVPIAAFPPKPAVDGAVLNVYTHLLGYCFGYVVPFVTFGLADVE